MASIKKILVPVDGSDNSKRALESALQLAAAVGAQLTVLHVREFEYGRLTFYGEQRPGEAVGPRPALDVVELCPVLQQTSVKWQAVEVEGHPADMICKQANSGGFDLVVVGSRGASALERFLVGSVSDRVVRHVDTNVMVVR